MIKHLQKFTPLGAVLLAAWLGAAQARAVQVNAYFEPALIHADQHTLYVLQISGSQGNISGDMPEIGELKVIGAQQSGSSVSIINGVTTMERSIRIPMTAEAPGEYTVPAFEIEVGGSTLPVPAAHLRVLPVDEAAKKTIEAASPVRLQLQLPPAPYYVGQAIPVTLTLNSDPMVSISGSSMPMKVGSDNYTLTEFTEMGSRRTEADGKIVNQYRIGAVVTPLSSGDMNLGFEQTILAYIPPQTRGESNRRSASNDPFAQFFGRDSLFDRMTNREELRLSTANRALKIEPLPADGKPRDFSGAIGQFNVSAPEISATTTEVGEPLTLRFSVEGIGNFDRIQPPKIQDADEWRSYAPQSQFQPHDAVGYSGSKTFEYTLIARSEKITQTPAIDFSYFDPQSGAYVSLPIPPLTIKVLPGTDSVGAAVVQAPAPAAASGADILPQMTSYRPAAGSLSLLISSPLFYSMQILPAAALAGFIFYRRHQLRIETDSRFARRHFARRRIRLVLNKARAQAAAGDTEGFYRSAATALQEVLSIDEPDIVAAALASGELHERLRHIGASEEDISLAQVFLQEADALQYASATLNAPLSQRLQELKSLLQKLETLCAQPATRQSI